MANFNVVVDGTQYSDTDIRIMRERIAELEDQLFDRNMLADANHHTIETQEGRIAELEAENKRLRQDAERFRKIEANGLTISYQKKGIGVHKPMTNYPYELHKTLAGAVDAIEGE